MRLIASGQLSQHISERRAEFEKRRAKKGAEVQKILEKKRKK